jgi:hypothetical protein
MAVKDRSGANEARIALSCMYYFSLIPQFRHKIMPDLWAATRSRSFRDCLVFFNKTNHNGCNLMSNDIIIIDSGAYGGTLAEHLVPSVESILLLEHGNQDLSERKTGG